MSHGYEISNGSEMRYAYSNEKPRKYKKSLIKAAVDLDWDLDLKFGSRITEKWIARASIMLLMVGILFASHWAWFGPGNAPIFIACPNTCEATVQGSFANIIQILDLALGAPIAFFALANFFRFLFLYFKFIFTRWR